VIDSPHAEDTSTCKRQHRKHKPDKDVVGMLEFTLLCRLGCIMLLFAPDVAVRYAFECVKILYSARLGCYGMPAGVGEEKHCSASRLVCHFSNFGPYPFSTS
jgi:hypothetical protein